MATARASAAAAAAPQPDEIRYYLDIAPADGVDISKPYRLTVTVRDGIPSTVFLPLTRR
ncbi:MAG: hypothetical protein ACJ8CR_16985 [Roseiflexaceae bacterium]